MSVLLARLSMPRFAIFILNVWIELRVSSRHKAFLHPETHSSHGKFRLQLWGRTIGITVGKTQTQHEPVLRGQLQKVCSCLYQWWCLAEVVTCEEAEWVQFSWFAWNLMGFEVASTNKNLLKGVFAAWDKWGTVRIWGYSVCAFCHFFLGRQIPDMKN